MDFFQAQQHAKTSTLRLLVLFGLAIISLIIITDVFVFIAFGMASSELGTSENIQVPEVNSTIFIIVSCIVAMVILLGSTYKWMVLSSGGGRYIAESMGARLILPDTKDLQEKRLMNVVEEMAIASGTPVPQVYVLDNEDGINAFAAGLTTGDAVIGVTRGTVESLSRDELQGVIAHEYSHILNGDMSLNMHLIGVLHGILILGMIGYFILRSTGHSRNRNSGGLIFFGIGLIVIGYGGTFFGNLIKSSISRQREYLADASAVQFTRNPEGIAGALKKIGGMPNRSRLKNERAPEMSHAYFSQGVSNYLGSMTATHPPLEERIRRIDPKWDGEFYAPRQDKTDLSDRSDNTKNEASQKRESVAKAIGSTIALQSVLNSISHIGNPGEEQIETARSIINDIPESIRDAIHDPYGARAVIYCLVMDSNDTVRKTQLAYLQANGDRGIHDLSLKYLPIVEKLKRRCRLPLIDMSLPALRELSAGQYSMFKKNLGDLVAADANLDLFEWCLQKILFKHLNEAFHETNSLNLNPKYSELEALSDECLMVLSVLAYGGHKNNSAAVEAFKNAIDVIGLNNKEIVPKSEIGLTIFDDALQKLEYLKPLSKKLLLKACLASVMADEKMTTRELELLRAIADTINCPIPPVQT